ncbi:hypothetical protein Tco_1256783 [Tanacetum coccineum]
MARFDLNQHAISLSEEDDVSVSNLIDLAVSSSNNTGCDSSASHDDNASYDSDLRLTPVLRPCSSTTQKPVTIVPSLAGIVQTACSSTHVETSTTTQKPVTIVPSLAGIVQTACSSTHVETSTTTQKPVRIIHSPAEYMKKLVEDVGEDDDFKSGSWVSGTDYVNVNGGIVSGCLGDIKNFLKNGKLNQVVAIVKYCSPNVIGDLTVTLKDVSGTLPGTIHHKVIDEGGYGNDINVGAALIHANVSIFTPKLSMHYLNITMRNVVKVFRKDTIPRSGSGMLMEEEEIVKLMEGEEMTNLELQVCGNVTNQEMADEEALNLVLDEEARQARAE